MRLVAAESIRADEQGSYVTDQGLTFVPRSGTELIVRESGGHVELLWLVPAGDAGRVGAVEYHW